MKQTCHPPHDKTACSIKADFWNKSPPEFGISKAV